MSNSNAASKLENIVEVLNSKSALKQEVFQQAIDLFENFKHVAQQIVTEINTKIQDKAKDVEVTITELGDYEFQIKFGGDTLVFLMHTNVFSFPDSHHINKSSYIKQNADRKYFGMVQMYNFLSDSLKYNRLRDRGFQLARIFVNMDNHFYVEGKRQLGFLYKNPQKNEVKPKAIREIIEHGMSYCLDFDLHVPPAKAFEQISIEQKNYFNNPSGMPTAKRLGFVQD